MTALRLATVGDIPLLDGIAQGMKHVHAQGYFARCIAERQVYIAFHGETAAGCAQLNFNPVYAMFRRLGLPEIQDLCVLPEFRRQGIGLALIKHCENVARAAGKTDMGISVGLHAAYGAAQRLYVANGYVPDGAGIAYDDESIASGAMKPIDDLLTLKLVKALV
jgi:GNAT superfamily N-acetyltransferase